MGKAIRCCLLFLCLIVLSSFTLANESIDWEKSILVEKDEARCVDSDGGINYGAQGTVFGIVNNEKSTKKDFCESGSELHEYYCIEGYVEGTNIFDQVYICLEGQVCTRGTCFYQTRPPAGADSCKDSDDGWDYYEKGYVESSASGKTEDFCHADGIRIAETGCSVYPGVAVYSYFACPNGCSNGACIKGSETFDGSACSDSDGGSDYEHQGTVAGKFKNERRYLNAADICSGDQLTEYTCGDEGYVHSESHTCSNGCGGGMCLKGETEVVNASIALTSTTEDRASTQGVFARGPGFKGTNKNDFEWTMSLKFEQSKSIKVMTIFHNTYGEAWTTSTEKNLGLDLYPLVVFKEGEQLNKKYDVSLGTYDPGTYEFTLYGQAESSTFSGGKILIVFSDGTTKTAVITGSGSVSGTPVPNPALPVPNLSKIANETPVKQKRGYLYASWECHDGSSQESGKEQPGNACMPPAYWLSRAKTNCDKKCSKETGKCGLSSFGLTTECEANEIVENQVVITNLTEFRQCIDSCSKDGKCYPFGFRKSDEYCSDTGAFVKQTKGHEACDNNFECSSNVCISNQCVSEGIINKFINWFKKLFG